MNRHHDYCNDPDDPKPQPNVEARLKALEDTSKAQGVHVNELALTVAGFDRRVIALETATPPDLAAIIARIVALESATNDPQAPEFVALEKRVNALEAKETTSLVRMDKAMTDMHSLSEPKS